MSSFWNKAPEPEVAPQQADISQEGAQFTGFEGENMALLESMYQIEAVTDFFSRISTVCFDKCMTRMKEADLNVAEMTCLDRCVVKYMEAQTIVGLKLKEQTEQIVNMSEQQSGSQ